MRILIYILQKCTKHSQQSQLYFQPKCKTVTAVRPIYRRAFHERVSFPFPAQLLDGFILSQSTLSSSCSSFIFLTAFQNSVFKDNLVYIYVFAQRLLYKSASQLPRKGSGGVEENHVLRAVVVPCRHDCEIASLNDS